jgi:hypothetical protein
VRRDAAHDAQARRAALAARFKRNEEVAKRARQDAACAWRFLHDGEPHDCIHPEAPCSREYDPLPTREAFPEDVRMYEDTAIGYLYGFIDTDRHAWQTAGWNIKRRRRRA